MGRRSIIISYHKLQEDVRRWVRRRSHDKGLYSIEDTKTNTLRWYRTNGNRMKEPDMMEQINTMLPDVAVICFIPSHSIREDLVSFGKWKWRWKWKWNEEHRRFMLKNDSRGVLWRSGWGEDVTITWTSSSSSCFSWSNGLWLPAGSLLQFFPSLYIVASTTFCFQWTPFELLYRNNNIICGAVVGRRVSVCVSFYGFRVDVRSVHTLLHFAFLRSVTYVRLGMWR